MFSFFNRKSNKLEVPNWASFFDASEYSVFIYETENYFKQKNIVFEILDGIVITEENKFGLNNLGLSNVAQNCKQDNSKNYKEIIKRHFNLLIEANKFELEFNQIVDKFEEVKKYLGVRLYNEEYIEHVGKEFVIVKKIESDIYAMIVFDFPQSISSVKPEQIEKWEKSVDEIFEIGIQNIKEKYPLTITKEDFDTFHIWFANSDHFFTPNLLFYTEILKEFSGSKG